MFEDLLVASRSGLDDAAGEEVGVDYWEGVGGLGEEGGDGGFPGGEGAGEGEEEHGLGFVGLGWERGDAGSRGGANSCMMIWQSRKLAGSCIRNNDVSALQVT